MPGFDKKKVLIADDDSILRELLKGILRTAGHIVVGEASNGEQAIAMVEKTSPDVLCLDIHMPKMDGMQCLEALKASMPQLTIIMISGEATLPVVQEALSKGAGGFIVKPFNAAKVLDTIQRVCAKQVA
ncbi:MAG: chemotaxis protein [Betaproteobacteria bacterium RBG_16_58_11]|nr:MAG: chemotaxis protein [Betaproteobacteria bacterium RBG_16_58_11]